MKSVRLMSWIHADSDTFWLVFLIFFMATVLVVDSFSPSAYEVAIGGVSDNYFISEVSRNIAAGNGWGLMFADQFQFLHPEISTGPVVFLPLALLLKTGLPLETARTVSTLSLNLGAWIWLLFRVRTLFPDSRYRLIWVASTLLVLGVARSQWYLALGEVPATLFLLIGMSYLAANPLSARKAFVTGLALGTALMCKLIILMALPFVALGFLWLVFSNRQLSNQQRMIWVIAALSGFAVVPLLAALWILGSIPGMALPGLATYHWNYVVYHFFYAMETDNSVLPICSDLRCLGVSFRALLDPGVFSGGIFYAAAATLSPFLGLMGLRFTSTGWRFLGLTSLAVLPLALWFYLYGPHYQGRYFFVAGVSALLAASGVVLMLIDKLPRLIRAGCLTVFFLLAVYGALPFYQVPARHPMHQDVLNLARAINDDVAIREVVWAGGGVAVPFPVSYLSLDKRWVTALAFFAENAQVDVSAYLSRYPDAGAVLTKQSDFMEVLAHAWQAGNGEDLHIIPLHWESADPFYAFAEKIPQAIQCADVFHESDHYALYRCEINDMEDYVMRITAERVRIESTGSAENRLQD